MVDERSELKGRSVLLIEDDPVMLRSLGQTFVQAGARVTLAADGEQGLIQFHKQRPDVVVTDIIMPNREGVETIMAMKAAAPAVQIVAISGGGRVGAAEFLSLARQLGADAVLAKPFRSAQIVDMVADLLGPASCIAA